MKNAFLLMVVSAFALQACASVNVVPPEATDFERTRTYEMTYEETWTRAVDWFADHNVIIEKIEKPSGLLTAKYRLAAGDRYLDCGVIDARGTRAEPRITRSGSLNVTVRELDEERTRVTVNFFGEFFLEAQDAWDGRPVRADGVCVSTGQLEQAVLDYIGQD